MQAADVHNITRYCMYADGYRSSPDMVMCFERIGERGQRVFARQNEKVEKKNRNQTKPRLGDREKRILYTRR